LADEGTVIAFGAMSGTSDPRKGYALLRDALATVSRQWNGHRPTLLVFGNHSRIEDRIDGFHCHFSGVTTSPERLALQYSAANAFVCPSVQENLPNTVAEALACGTPCVAFGIGGLPELIDAGRNGFLAKPFDTRDLARCIQLALALPAEAARTAARAKAEAMLAESTVAAGYRSLYEELVNRRSQPGARHGKRRLSTKNFRRTRQRSTERGWS
jgi:glycosyltransferase involved in cell wall biosynthesis